MYGLRVDLLVFVNACFLSWCIEGREVVGGGIEVKVYG